MTTPFKSKMSLDQLKEAVDKGMNGQQIMDKFEVTNHTLKDKSFDLAKRENNISYCLDIPATVPSYEVQVTDKGRLNLPKALLEYENVKAETKFIKPVVVNDKLTAVATITDKSHPKKILVSVAVTNAKNELVFEGAFVCFVLEKHILAE